MTRLSTDIVDVVDALVTLNVFKSRSEAVAAYVENSILSNGPMYEKIVEQAKAVEGMRDSAMEEVLETLQKSDE
jgi:Arc/MetJ-type ribon-helix-helix transcriptional regulator